MRNYHLTMSLALTIGQSVSPMKTLQQVSVLIGIMLINRRGIHWMLNTTTATNINGGEHE